MKNKFSYIPETYEKDWSMILKKKEKFCKNCFSILYYDKDMKIWYCPEEECDFSFMAVKQ